MWMIYPLIMVVVVMVMGVMVWNVEWMMIYSNEKMVGEVNNKEW